MPTATVTATTETVHISSQDNVHYNVAPTSNITFQVAPHAPSER